MADETIAAWVPSGMGARRSLSVGAEKPSCVFRFCHSSKTQKANRTVPAMTPPRVTTIPSQAAIAVGSTVNRQLQPVEKQAHEPRLCYNNVLTSSDSSRRNPCR